LQKLCQNGIHLYKLLHILKQTIIIQMYLDVSIYIVYFMDVFCDNREVVVYFVFCVVSV